MTTSPITRSNPFYLLSAGCMLAGCYLWTGADSEAPREVLRLLPILGWLTLYELIVIGLAAFLYRSGLANDSRCLLFVEAIFLADATHLTAEAVSWSRAAWPLATLAFAALTAGKLTLIMKGLRVDAKDMDIPRLVLPLALILALPGAFAAIARTGASLDLALYGASWIVALVLLFEVLAGGVDANADAAASSFRRSLRYALLISLGAHVLAVHWMYDVTVRACSLAPLLLVLSVYVTRSSRALESQHLRFALPASAVLLSLWWPQTLAVGTVLVFTPFRAATILAALVYAYDYSLHRQLMIILSAAACGLTAAAGPSFLQAVGRLADLADAVGGWASRLLPRTRAQWGAYAVVVSYLLLSIGAWRSLRRERS
jgi:hypothetical protein